MVKFFHLLMAVILIFCLVYPASAGVQTPQSASIPQPPGYPQVQKATVILTGVPSGANIYVDHTMKTVASPTYPSRSVSLSLSPGTHTIGINAAGYHPWSGDTSVRSGETKTVIVNLVPENRQTNVIKAPAVRATPTFAQPGELTVTVTPSHAYLTIDGSRHSPGFAQFLCPGIHTVQVNATGYFPKMERVQVDSGDASHISIELEKDPNYIEPVEQASLEVTSSPTGASVYVEGRPNGTTPCVITAPVGPRTVTLRLEGYLDRVETVDIHKTSGHTTQKVFWILTPSEQDQTPQPEQTEVAKRMEAASMTPRGTLKMDDQQNEPTDLLQYVMYYIRGIFGE